VVAGFSPNYYYDSKYFILLLNAAKQLNYFSNNSAAPLSGTEKLLTNIQ
jgi:hypothetical protein